MARPPEEPVTLKEVQLRLGVPQHVLIHLCEKGVVVPELGDTSGRGKRRAFSQRNVFELGVALALRELEVSVASSALFVRLLRSFERALAKAVPGFVLLEFLALPGAEFRLSVYDGRLLALAARGGALRKLLVLGVKLGRADARPTIERLAELPHEFDGRMEIDLVRIARRIEH